jgi:hypothetical protein
MKWENEPDLVEFEAFGFKCEVRRHPKLRHLCGYVTVPEGHPMYGKTYDEVHDMTDIEVHGGLTFSKDGQFGFDCAHAFDLVPHVTEVLNGREGVDVEKLQSMDTYRDMGFTIDETYKLARQLGDIK